MLNRAIAILFLTCTLFVVSCKKKYPDIKVSRASITLSNGAVEEYDATVGSSPEDNSQDYIIENVGTKDLNISSIKLSGSGASAFTLDTKQFTSGSVAVGNTVTFTVLMKTNAVGNYSGIIDVESDAKDNTTFKLNLSGSVH
jgi:hypothetical protein